MLALALTMALGADVPQGQALLDDLSQRAVQFFWNESHPSSGFTKDRAANLTNGDSYTVASVASTGFAMVALAVGSERGWLDRTAALERARVTAINLRYRAAKNRGWFYHFINWFTGARVWNCEVSSIDTSILVAGLLVADRYFKDTQLTGDINAIVNAIDWQWMLTNGGTQPNALTYSHGWRPENGWISARWGDYSEQLILMVQGLGASPSVPDGTWTAIQRNMYMYEGLQLLTGGPLFIHQMSQGFLEFENRRDKLGYDYWIATRRATIANRTYCINNPRGFAAYGPLFWGLTASDGPDGYDAFGAPVWGSDNGTVAPTCVAASIEFTPIESQQTLDSMRVTYPQAYGRYGFSNALNPHRNWVGPDVIGIDLGMMLCAIENKRDNFVHRHSAQHPINQVGMKRAGFVTYRRSSREDNILRRP